MLSACPVASRPSASRVCNPSPRDVATWRANSVLIDAQTGQSALPTTCPICEHTPVSADGCTPHKSLRTTVKVFLRTQEKKNEEAKLRESKDATPVTPIEPKPIPAPSQPQAANAPQETPALASDAATSQPTDASVAAEAQPEQSSAEIQDPAQVRRHRNPFALWDGN